MSDKSILQDDRKSAILSDCRTYRYRLTRQWDVDKPSLAFIMLNPSTADETEDDPTIRRCIGYAKQWGYGSLIVGNLFALRATDPSELKDHDNPVGPENNAHLKQITTDASKVIAAWGVHGSLYNRDSDVVDILESDLYALNTTQDGHPNHPLYQPKDADLEVFSNAP